MKKQTEGNGVTHFDRTGDREKEGSRYAWRTEAKRRERERTKWSSSLI